jgi:NitT/TauT family transport system substrate-binding protein
LNIKEMDMGRILAGALLIALAWSTAARAEVSEIKAAQQYGISYLPLMLMEEGKLIEKQAKAAGVDLTVNWVKFSGGNVMNDAIISGDLAFASGGVAPLVTIWARTHGTLDVKAVSAINSMPLYLNSRNPAVKAVKDFSDKDRIALPAVKSSIQAVTLQMAAEREFGPGNFAKLDSLTVTRSHPDAQAALLSNTEINAHFSSPPFQYQQLRRQDIHTVLNSYEVLGGPATFNLVWAAGKFVRENPKVYAAFVKALEEAIAAINGNKQAAAEAYLRISKDKDSVQEILAMLNDPKIVYTLTPQNMTKYVDFMFKVGSIKIKPDSWKDMFFPNAHSLAGS